MAYACDMCLSLVRSSDALARLGGWYGQHEIRSATARKEAGYRQVPLGSESTVEGHICRRCVEGTLAKDVRVNAEKPRAVLRAERRKAFPKEAAFVNLRKTAPLTEDILCDRCEVSCFERHVELRSTWVDDDQSHQVVHLCGQCYETYLWPRLVGQHSRDADAVAM